MISTENGEDGGKKSAKSELEQQKLLNFKNREKVDENKLADSNT